MWYVVKAGQSFLGRTISRVGTTSKYIIRTFDP